MLPLYRSLLLLYPRAYRFEYGQEMLAVLCEVQTEIQKKSAFRRAILCSQEAVGLLHGALHEHLRSITSSYYPVFSSRRITMRSEFRFPKATVALMTVILAAVLVTIDKARSIQLSLPHTSTPVGPIKEAQFTALPSMFLALIGACIAGVLGWAVFFALRRSGTHRFSAVNPSSAQRSGH